MPEDGRALSRDGCDDLRVRNRSAPNSPATTARPSAPASEASSVRTARAPGRVRRLASASTCVPSFRPASRSSSSRGSCVTSASRRLRASDPIDTGGGRSAGDRAAGCRRPACRASSGRRRSRGSVRPIRWRRRARGRRRGAPHSAWTCRPDNRPPATARRAGRAAAAAGAARGRARGSPDRSRRRRRSAA